MPRLHDDKCRFQSCLGCRYIGLKEETYDIQPVERDSPCIHPESEGDTTTRTSAPMPDSTDMPNKLEIAATRRWLGL